MSGVDENKVTLTFELEEDGRFIATLSRGDEERVICYGTDEYTAAAQALRVFFEVERGMAEEHELKETP